MLIPFYIYRLKYNQLSSNNNQTQIQIPSFIKSREPLSIFTGAKEPPAAP